MSHASQPVSPPAGDPAATPDPADEPAAVATLEAELAAARQAGLGHLRRALLAEHTGNVVPELIDGDTPEALEASVAAARAAFERAREAALAALERERAAAAPAIAAGTPARDTAPAGPSSPIEKIAAGLRQTSR